MCAMSCVTQMDDGEECSASCALVAWNTHCTPHQHWAEHAQDVASCGDTPVALYGIVGAFGLRVGALVHSRIHLERAAIQPLMTRPLKPSEASYLPSERQKILGVT